MCNLFAYPGGLLDFQDSGGGFCLKRPSLGLQTPLKKTEGAWDPPEQKKCIEAWPPGVVKPEISNFITATQFSPTAHIPLSHKSLSSLSLA